MRQPKWQGDLPELARPGALFLGTASTGTDIGPQGRWLPEARRTGFFFSDRGKFTICRSSHGRWVAAGGAWLLDEFARSWRAGLWLFSVASSHVVNSRALTSSTSGVSDRSPTGSPARSRSAFQRLVESPLSLRLAKCGENSTCFPRMQRPPNPAQQASQRDLSS
jgi:hypothetical protein